MWRVPSPLVVSAPLVETQFQENKEEMLRRATRTFSVSHKTTNIRCNDAEREEVALHPPIWLLRMGEMDASSAAGTRSARSGTVLMLHFVFWILRHLGGLANLGMTAPSRVSGFLNVANGPPASTL